MRKERKADLLLCAAKHWQNCEDRASESERMQDVTDYVCNNVPDVIDGRFNGIAPWLDNCASAALSEVAALGFDIEDA